MTCFTKNGITLRKWCIDNNFHYHMLYRRLDNGMSVDEAINEVKKMKDSGRKLRSHPVLFHNGKPIVDTYDERSYRLIIQRKHRGISTENAIKMGKLTQKAKE